MKRRRSKEKMDELMSKVSYRIQNGETVTSATENEGVHYSTYYNYKNKGKLTAAKPTTKIGRGPGRKLAIKQPKNTMGITEITGLPKGKTLLIVSDDADLITNIITRFTV